MSPRNNIYIDNSELYEYNSSLSYNVRNDSNPSGPKPKFPLFLKEGNDPDDKVFIEFPARNKNGCVLIYESWVNKQRLYWSYLGVDVRKEILKATAWIKEHPNRLGPNVSSRLSKWFMNAADRNGRDLDDIADLREEATPKKKTCAWEDYNASSPKEEVIVRWIKSKRFRPDWTWQDFLREDFGTRLPEELFNEPILERVDDGLLSHFGLSKEQIKDLRSGKIV